MDCVTTFPRPDLRQPVLITAFAGWNDAAEVATSSARLLVRRWGAPKCAEIDPEEFYVFSDTRPQVKSAGPFQRQIIWPTNDFFYAQAPELDHDFLILIGNEPQLRWRTFTQAVIGYAQSCGVSQVLCLGALLADVLHNGLPQLTGSASDAHLADELRRLTVHSSGYEGPTGIVGVLSAACREVDLPSGSVWGNIPHYVSSAFNPRVSAAILRTVQKIYRFDLDLGELDRATERFDVQIAEAISRNPDVATYVRGLEQRQREAQPVEESPSDAPELPSGDVIVRELEEFLRRRPPQGDEDI